MTRTIRHRYIDPLDALWIRTARAIGFEVERSAEVFASVADGIITVGTPETLDADDCLAQMILHELCHSLVQGPDLLSAPDWGLANIGEGDLVREQACLRLQAALLARHGLRAALAPTTEHRAFYDALGSDPLTGGEQDVTMARTAWARTGDTPWSPHLRVALESTESIIARVARDAPEESLWALYEPGPAR